MKKQTKMEYVSPSIAEIELLADFMQQIANSQDLPDMNATEVDESADDFWTLN